MPRSAPVAPARKPAPVAAPAARKPGLPAKPQGKAAVMAPVMASAPAAPVAKPRGAVNAARPAPAAPVAVARPAARPAPAPEASESAALRAELSEAKAEIAKLTAAIGKASAKRNAKGFRSDAEIVEGIVIPEGDWRAPYHGAEFPMLDWDRAPFRGTEARTEITIGEGPTVQALLAMPRDADGPDAPSARRLGMIAVHSNRSEDGTGFVGAPVFLTQEELSAIWAE